MFPRPGDQVPTLKQTVPSADDTEWPVRQSPTKPLQSAFNTSFLKRRHDDAFPSEDIAEEEETSPSKKYRSSAPEILPRIHHLSSPRDGNRKRRHRVSDRDRKRKIAAERALIQSFRQIGLLQATTIRNIEVQKKYPLAMALGPSNYDDPSDYLLALPIAQTSDSDLCDYSEAEEPEAANPITYVVLADGQYRFDLESVAYELMDEVFGEEAAHYKWMREVDRSVTADIEEYVRLNPEFGFMTVRQRERKIFELSREPDDAFIKQWHETCKDIPFGALEEESLEAQLIMSIARAAYLNPLPSDVPEDEIEEFVEKVQRIGIEYHRAHNRKFLYLWKEKVKEMRKLEKYMKERQERELQVFLHTPQKEQEHAEWQLPSPPEDVDTQTYGIKGLDTIASGNSVLSTTSLEHGMSPVGSSPPEPAFGMDPLLLALEDGDQLSKLDAMELA